MFTYSDFSTGTKKSITITTQEINNLSQKIISLLKTKNTDMDDGVIHKTLFPSDSDFCQYAITLGVLQHMKKQGIVESIPLGYNEFAWELTKVKAF